MEEFGKLNLTTPGTHECFIDAPTAKKILDEYNWKNRGKKSSKIGQYTRDMDGGRWVFNGDPIRFAVDQDERAGEVYLADGQNRMQAQVNSNTTQRWVVITGLIDAAQETIDRGANRTPSDMARLRGIPHASYVMAICARAWLYEDQHRLATGRIAASMSESFAYYERDPEGIQAAARKFHKVSLNVPVNPTTIMTSYYLAAKQSQEAADIFFEQKLVQGIGIGVNDPVGALRQRLTRMALLAGNRKAEPAEAMRYIITAWNHDRKGNKIQKLQRPASGWRDDLLVFI